MKITYTGRQVELVPAQLKKVEAAFAKVGKLLDGKSECEAHVILSVERHMQRAEVTVSYHGRRLAVLGSNADLFTAIHAAAEKLEKQALKLRGKERETKRKKAAPAPLAAAAEPEPEAEAELSRQVFRVNHHQRRKPMTLDEAVIAMEKGNDYLVYRDAETDGISVLLRRRDGHFDLVQA
jgi:putative sigma-54 modulation protein